jgi:intron-binding protein aquarius
MKSNPKRKLKLKLDPAQYYSDIKEGLDCYDAINLLIRRKPKENNNKAILYTIRELMNSSDDGRTIPSWLHDIFLGYGKPDAAYYRLNKQPSSTNQPTNQPPSS